MKIVVIGGTGLIGSKTVERLRKKGHEVLAASPNGGVNTITGEGLGGGSRRSAGCHRPGEFALVRGQGRSGVLRDLRPKPARRGNGRRREAPHRAFDRGGRAPAQQRLSARQDGPGEADQGLRHPLHHRSLDAVLRVPGRHRPVGNGRGYRPRFHLPIFSRSRRTTSPTSWPTWRSPRRSTA